MAQSADEREFARQLLEWGLLSRQELDGALKLHDEACRDTSPPPTLSETLVRYGFLTPRQVAQAQNTGRDASPALSDTIPVDVLVALHNSASKFGKYILLGEVGRGGASVIHKAWDTEEKAYVALKFLRAPEGSAAEPGRAEELIREGWRAVELRHPNIIRIYELGCISRQYYLAMEYLEGFTLAELIHNARGRSKVSPFYEDPARYLTMLRDVARAVHYAHSRTPPLIHCDLKPANIFIELSWRPYVLDFGVAHELSSGEGETGTLKGSPAYMAPEQVLAKPEALDVRTDVYGLGAILYDLLTGRPPFTGELQEVLDKNLLVAPPKPSDVLRLRSEISCGTVRDYRVPPEIEAICMKCLEKEKGDRYPTAKDVAEALTQAMRLRPVTQIRKPETALRRPPTEEKTPTRVPAVRKKDLRSPARVKFLLVGMLGGLALLAGLSALYVVGGSDDDSAREHLQMEMDALAGTLELDAARDGYREFAEKHPDPETQEWVRECLDDLEAIRRMRSALAAYLSETTPRLPTFDLRGERYTDAKVLHATYQGVELLVNSDRVDIDWGKVEPSQVVRLVRRLPEQDARVRLGLASFAVKNALKADAADVLLTLRGAPELEPKVRRLGEQLKPKK